MKKEAGSEKILPARACNDLNHCLQDFYRKIERKRNHRFEQDVTKTMDPSPIAGAEGRRYRGNRLVMAVPGHL